MVDKNIEAANAEFWNELCGAPFAQRLGIIDHSVDSLRRFDKAYMDMYPYLLRRVPVATMEGKSVLEIGLGYGTLGQIIASHGARYIGLDIAAGPVRMLNERLRMQGIPGKAVRGSILHCPFPDASMDVVVSIGCFHHTGDTQRCVDETWRVLRAGGEAYIMVYNQLSYRQWLRWPGVAAGALLRDLGFMKLAVAPSTESQRRAYDPSLSGVGAPETAFFSITQLRAMFHRFRSADIVKENCDHITRHGRALVPRAPLLATIGRIAGLDLYVAARK